MRGGKRARSKLNSSAEYQLLCPYTNKTWAIDLLIPRTLRTVTTGTGTQHNGHGMLSLSDDHGFQITSRSLTDGTVSYSYYIYF